MGKHRAEYSDMEMMYHFIVMNELKWSAAEAAEYSIHGLKHFMITAATQLNFERTTIGKLGHWHHGSKMRDKYNQSKCVHELMCRTQIQQQFVSGWKPVDGSELPQEWIDLDKASTVSNDKLKRENAQSSSLNCLRQNIT